MQHYRHPLGQSRAQTAEGPQMDLYGLPTLPPEAPVPQPAPAPLRSTRPVSDRPRRDWRGVRVLLVGLGLAAGVLVTGASAAALLSGL